MKLKPAVQISRRIAEIGREAWDACAGHPDHRGNPFVAFDFLDIAEAAGCAVERTGWGPQHLAVEDEAGQVAAVMPLYLKSHSQGEYVFDHAWADAYERAGGQYYPKLISAAMVESMKPGAVIVDRDFAAELGQRRIGFCILHALSQHHIIEIFKHRYNTAGDDARCGVR